VEVRADEVHVAAVAADGDEITLHPQHEGL
jgi:hypothetical protein